MALLHRAVGSREVPDYARLFLVKVCATLPALTQVSLHIEDTAVLMSVVHDFVIADSLTNLVAGGSSCGSSSSGP